MEMDSPSPSSSCSADAFGSLPPHAAVSPMTRTPTAAAARDRRTGRLMVLRTVTTPDLHGSALTASIGGPGGRWSWELCESASTDRRRHDDMGHIPCQRTGL